MLKQVTIVSGTAWVMILATFVLSAHADNWICTVFGTSGEGSTEKEAIAEALNNCHARNDSPTWAEACRRAVPSCQRDIRAVINLIFPLDGRWIYQGRPGPIIMVNGNRITVNMSTYDRPKAVGQIINNNLIVVKFPDVNESFTGRLVPPNKIEWSNHTTWRKE